MDVKYITLPASRVDSYPIVDGQILAVFDELGWYYDMNNQRYLASSIAAYSSTGSEFAIKVASSSRYTLKVNSFIWVVLQNSNTLHGEIQLDINGTGALPIYIDGAISSSSNYTLPAGSYFVFCDGHNYYFRNDDKITASITGDAATVNGHTVDKNVPTTAQFTDTWIANSSTSDGYVAATNGQPHKVWKTDENGNPEWREDDNGDTQVTQTATTTNADYEILFSNTADNTTRTEEARKSDKLRFNPSSGNLQATQLNGQYIGNAPVFTDTWIPMVGASASADGTAGYVNSVPPQDGYDSKYLRADGTWQVPPGTGVEPASSAPQDVATASAVGTSAKYAREDHKHKITLATGDNNGQVKIAGTNVTVKGLGNAAYKDVDPVIAADNHDLVTGSAVYDFVDQQVTAAIAQVISTSY